MADKRSLRLIGALYGGMTAVVALIAVIIVGDHLTGRMSLEAPATAGTSIAGLSTNAQ